jgi:hypothetical protein
MASNGLVANPSKTVFVIMGDKTIEETKLKVGENEIVQSRKSKLLDMNVDSD